MDKITDAINYEYQILRYRHDAVSGEFVNIGVVFFDVDNRILRTRIAEKHERILQFFGQVSSAFLLKTTKHIENEFNKIAQDLANGKNISFKSIKKITSSVLPINDNGLFFSEVHKGWHFNFYSAFDATFDRLVGRYNRNKNDILAMTVKDITEIITVPEYFKVDFMNFNALICGSSNSIKATGFGVGNDRALLAVDRALSFLKLENNNIKKAKYILIIFTSNKENLSIRDEILTVEEFVKKEVSNEVKVIWGSFCDDNLGDKIAVTLIASGVKSHISSNTKDTRSDSKNVVPMETVYG